MLGSLLPLKIIHNDQAYLLDHRLGTYFIAGLDHLWYQLDNRFPDDFQLPHIANWFKIDYMPPPKLCTYIQCPIRSVYWNNDTVSILVGHAEKYRKYFYPLQIDLKAKLIYLTGQPIYYNFNQSILLDINGTPPVLRIQSFSRANNSQTIYRVKSKERVDFLTEKPINLINTFTLNSS